MSFRRSSAIVLRKFFNPFTMEKFFRK